MERDLEDELRLAMEELVGDTVLPRALASDVTRRYRRRVVRRRLAAVAVVTAIAGAALPAYRMMNPPRSAMLVGPRVGTDGTASPVPSRSRAGVSPVPSTPAGTLPPHPQRPGTPPVRPPGPPNPPNPAQPVTPPAAPNVTMGFLPSGLSPVGPCQSARSGSRLTMTCRWTGVGAAGVVLQTIRQPGFSAPGDVGLAFLVPEPTEVQGWPAIAGDKMDGGRAVVWMQRNGLAVQVSVTAALRDQLMPIADGAHVTS